MLLSLLIRLELSSDSNRTSSSVPSKALEIPHFLNAQTIKSAGISC
jgi:hypothetical protein